jgi:hypothetical protein
MKDGGRAGKQTKQPPKDEKGQGTKPKEGGEGLMSRWKGRSAKALEEMGMNDGGKVMKKPDKAKGTRKPITTKNPPGGSQTPGAKAAAAKKKKK